MRAWINRGSLSIGLLALAGLHCGGSKGVGGGGGASGHGGLLPDAGDGPVTSGIYTQVFLEAPNRQVDLLFMIDKSSSMEMSQATFVAALPAFMNVLKGLAGGLPDLHIAVVTSDMGAGDGSITGCSGNGDNGVFQAAPKGSCTSTTLQSAARYISDTGGASPQTNFTAADITTVLQCIVPVGANGCGFEHQLAAMVRALGADGQGGPPQENAGFLRDSAYLAVVLLTNEDDCSAPVNSVLFDTNTNTSLASQVGPPGNFRCNEFGHLCSFNGGAAAPPSRLSPMPADLTTSVMYDNCVSAESAGLLTPIATYAQGLKALKADPSNQIVVATIQGPTAPYVVHWTKAPTNDTGPWPSVQHACTTATGGFADPGIRMQQFAQQFGSNGLVYNICSEDFAPAMTTIATKIASLTTAGACFQALVRSKDASGATFDPDCTVTETVPNNQGGSTQTVLPACAHNGSTPPCWSLETPPALSCPSGSHVVVINRGGTPPATGARFTLQCSVCPAGSTNPACV